MSFTRHEIHPFQGLFNMVTELCHHHCLNSRTLPPPLKEAPLRPPPVPLLVPHTELPTQMKGWRGPDHRRWGSLLAGGDIRGVCHCQEVQQTPGKSAWMRSRQLGGCPLPCSGVSACSIPRGPGVPPASAGPSLELDGEALPPGQRRLGRWEALGRSRVPQARPRAGMAGADGPSSPGARPLPVGLSPTP